MLSDDGTASSGRSSRCRSSALAVSLITLLLLAAYSRSQTSGGTGVRRERDHVQRPVQREQTEERIDTAAAAAGDRALLTHSATATAAAVRSAEPLQPQPHPVNEAHSAQAIAATPTRTTHSDVPASIAKPTNTTIVPRATAAADNANSAVHPLPDDRASATPPPTPQSSPIDKKPSPRPVPATGACQNYCPPIDLTAADACDSPIAGNDTARVRQPHHFTFEVSEGAIRQERARSLIFDIVWVDATLSLISHFYPDQRFDFQHDVDVAALPPSHLSWIPLPLSHERYHPINVPVRAAIYDLSVTLPFVLTSQPPASYIDLRVRWKGMERTYRVEREGPSRAAQWRSNGKSSSPPVCRADLLSTSDGRRHWSLGIATLLDASSLYLLRPFYRYYRSQGFDTFYVYLNSDMSGHQLPGLRGVHYVAWHAWPYSTQSSWNWKPLHPTDEAYQLHYHLGQATFLHVASLLYRRRHDFFATYDVDEFVQLAPEKEWRDDCQWPELHPQFKPTSWAEQLARALNQSGLSITGDEVPCCLGSYLYAKLCNHPEHSEIQAPNVWSHVSEDHRPYFAGERAAGHVQDAFACPGFTAYTSLPTLAYTGDPGFFHRSTKSVYHSSFPGYLSVHASHPVGRPADLTAAEIGAQLCSDASLRLRHFLNTNDEVRVRSETDMVHHSFKSDGLLLQLWN
jgi:hypothetical protein